MCLHFCSSHNVFQDHTVILQEHLLILFVTRNWLCLDHHLLFLLSPSKVPPNKSTMDWKIAPRSLNAEAARLRCTGSQIQNTVFRTVLRDFAQTFTFSRRSSRASNARQYFVTIGKKWIESLRRSILFPGTLLIKHVTCLWTCFSSGSCLSKTTPFRKTCSVLVATWRPAGRFS